MHTARTVMTPHGKRIDHLLNGQVLYSEYLWLWPTRSSRTWRYIALVAIGADVATIIGSFIL